jgi:hypothetical protein
LSFATYEDFMAEVPVIVPEPALCIGCETGDPEPGADHCQPCLDLLSPEVESYYGDGPLTDMERHQHNFELKRRVG